MPDVPRILLLTALALVLAGCGQSEVPDEPPPAVTPPASATAEEAPPADIEEVIQQAPAAGGFSFAAYAYDCNGIQLAVSAGEGEITLFLPDRELTLPQVEAASGAKYAAGDDVFWGRGMNSAILTLDGEEMDCRLDRRETPWADARFRGALFRAVGNEPGWHLEIHPDRLVLVRQFGDERAVVPNPGEQTEPGQPVSRWHAVTEAHELSVTVEARACTDIMSGEIFPATVTATLDGREYSGCGRRLD